ncbi:MAG: lipopolysaccharide kinase InaA family protein [Candidatus Binatia bacterium]
MLEQWVWGNTPPGFRKIWLNRERLMLVHEELDPYLIATRVLHPAGMREQSTSFCGRGILRRIRFGSGDEALVRAYRHGGILRRVTGEFFFTWPTRPFRELALTEEVRQRGIPTLDILAALVERSWGPFYRGWLVTRELGGAQDLWMALRNDVSVWTQKLLLQAVARSVRQMHLQGVYHADLNLKNILVRWGNGEIKTYVIDFDKARLYPHEVPLGQAQRNLNRLLGSVRKLDPNRQYLSEENWAVFMDYYHQGP